MLHIYICDDSRIHLDAIKSIVNSHSVFSETIMKIKLATTNPNELITYIKNMDTSNGNVYFLDIDLSNQTYDGLALATKIREKDPLGFIVFITSHIEFGFLTFEYKIGAFDYILKTKDTNLLTSRVKGTLGAIEKRWQTIIQQEHSQQQTHRIRFVSDYEEKYIGPDEIIVIEVIGNHKLHVLTKYQSFESNGTLGKLEKELPDFFFRCHRSYLVNLKEIKTTFKNDEKIILSNDFEIRCSRKVRKILSDKLNTLI